MQPKRLGKGLTALVADAAMEGQGQDQALLIREIPISQIHPNPDQPRKSFQDESLDELAQSIREKGVIQPIIVQPVQDGTYQIVAGERRYRASQRAGLTTMPAIVREYGLEDKLEVALIENIQREDLNPIEEALAYRHLMDAFALSQDEVAKKVGKNRSTVANSIRLLKLPDVVVQAISVGKISAGHARAILSTPMEKHLEFFHHLLNHQLSVREAESVAKGINLGDPQWAVASSSNPPAPSITTKPSAAAEDDTEGVSRKPVELVEIEEKLRFALGTKVAVKGSFEQGKIEVAYFSMEDLERVVGLLSRS